MKAVAASEPIVDIIYMLVNETKSTFPNKYVGSKQECSVVDVDGVPTILSKRSGKPYYSSAQSDVFWADFNKGHKISAKVLYVVKEGEDIRKVEESWLKELDVMNSEEFYNLTDKSLGWTSNVFKAYNLFGQSLAEVANDRSTLSKKDGTAKALGFENFALLYEDIHNQRKEGKNWAEISRGYDRQRHFAKVFVSPYSYERYLESLDSLDSDTVRDMYSKGATVKYIATELGAEIPAVRKVLGCFMQGDEATYLVAKASNKTVDELEVSIIRKVLSGMSYSDIQRETGICKASVARYFLRGLRKRIDPSEIN